MTIEEMNEIRRETGVTYQQICFDSGVKEYWIVDPIKKSVTIFNLMLLRGETEEGTEIEKYTFDDTVPVIISNGACGIDMKKAAAHLDRVFGEAWRTAKLGT